MWEERDAFNPIHFQDYLIHEQFPPILMPEPPQPRLGSKLSWHSENIMQVSLLPLLLMIVIAITEHN